MSASVFLITPPFTQLNTPYPATAYLKGFLNTKNITSFQADLGIEVTLALFSRKGTEALFSRITERDGLSDNVTRILALQDDYIHTIDDVVLFLRGKIPHWRTASANATFFPKPPVSHSSKTLTGPLGPWVHMIRQNTLLPCTSKICRT
ncbi:hypothetical protein MKQ70_08150 [Chitinophaga sedimenti]|uniref:hypothetical protein n=1 Tax=Chitinophaga sedimenti TaxID=2033606 RepID=UPI0020060FB4|nr:hypothetical protein [Chitinophaga sedimenti]MCK7554977.1 hypothetical protein [Chitinophaga sedimenti]